MGIIISHYKDPGLNNQDSMESKSFFLFFVAQFIACHWTKFVGFVDWWWIDLSRHHLRIQGTLDAFSQKTERRFPGSLELWCFSPPINVEDYKALYLQSLSVQL